MTKKELDLLEMRKQDITDEILLLATETNRYKKLRNLPANSMVYSSLFSHLRDYKSFNYEVIKDEAGYRFIKSVKLFGKSYTFEED